MASKTGRMAPPGYPTADVLVIFLVEGKQLREQRTDMLHVMPQHHLVEDFSSSLANEPGQCLVSHIVALYSGGNQDGSQTYDSSMSFFLPLTRGWTWLWSLGSTAALNAGLGLARTSLFESKRLAGVGESPTVRGPDPREGHGDVRGGGFGGG